MNKNRLVLTVSILAVAIVLVSGVWISKYNTDARCSPYKYIQFEIARAGVFSINENVREAENNVSMLLTMKDFQKPVKSYKMIKHLSTIRTLFSDSEKICYSSISEPFSNLTLFTPMEQTEFSRFSKNILSVCSALSNDQSRSVNKIISDVENGRFNNKDMEYLQKLDNILKKLNGTLENINVNIYDPSEIIENELKDIRDELRNLAKSVNEK